MGDFRRLAAAVALSESTENSLPRWACDRMARYCATGARPEEFGTIGKSLPRAYDAMRSAKLEHLNRQGWPFAAVGVESIEGRYRRAGAPDGWGRREAQRTGRPAAA